MSECPLNNNLKYCFFSGALNAVHANAFQNLHFRKTNTGKKDKILHYISERKKGKKKERKI